MNRHRTGTRNPPPLLYTPPSSTSEGGGGSRDGCMANTAGSPLYSSWATKGLAISSQPSIGEMRLTCQWLKPPRQNRDERHVLSSSSSHSKSQSQFFFKEGKKRRKSGPRRAAVIQGKQSDKKTRSRNRRRQHHLRPAADHHAECTRIVGDAVGIVRVCNVCTCA